MMNAAAKLTLAVFSTACLAEGYYLGALNARRAASADVEQPGVAARPRVSTAAGGVSGIRTELSATDDEIVVTFLVPGLKAETLSIAVAEARVTINCDADRRYEMIMPVPAQADAARLRVVREGEAFQIIFPKLDDPTLRF
jgi:hypothetical protein